MTRVVVIHRSVMWLINRCKIIALCLCSLHANAEVMFEPYGKLSASFGVVNEVDYIGVESTPSSDRYSRYNNHASRVGVRADVKGVWLDRFFSVVEYGMNFDSGKSKTFPLRDGYIGIEEGIASVIVGQMNTPTKLAQGNVDLFNDILDMKSLIAGENNGDMAVVALDLEMFSVTVASIEDDHFSDGGLGGGWSSSIAGRGKDYYWSVSGDRDVNNTDSVRALVGGKFVNWMWAGLWQTSKSRLPSSDYEGAILVSAGVYHKKILYKMQVIHSDMTDTVKGFLGVKGRGTNMISLGLDYRYSPESLLYVYSGYASNNDEKSYTMGLGVTYQF